MGAPDRLSDSAADVDDTELGAALQLVGQRNCVCDDDLREATLVDRIDGVSLLRISRLAQLVMGFQKLPVRDLGGVATYAEDPVSLLMTQRQSKIRVVVLPREDRTLQYGWEPTTMATTSRAPLFFTVSAA